jgi:photosystem II stability/assembly factor-like uncharacterized protein
VFYFDAFFSLERIRPMISRSMPASLLLLSLVLAVVAPTPAQAGDTVRHVAVRTPVLGNSREMAADRPAIPAISTASPLVNRRPNPWKLLATLPGAVIHDISFATPQIGYVAAEAGQVWKTTNGGLNWTEILNANYPYYWYGVKALTANDVVISGISDTSTIVGLIRWSHDGGATWTDDIVLTDTGFVQRVRFANKHNGLVMDLDDGATNSAYYTLDGGATAADWTAVDDNPDGGWFGLEFSLLFNGHARASGINFCFSPDNGATWTCGPSVDPVFDGPVFFQADSYGWVGGGEISPNVEGWVHRTTNGGQNWSGRTLDIGWPIREIFFLNAQIGWAAGGNVYTGVGGMYFSSDGGQTWSLDVTTGSEMDACDGGHIKTNGQIWCAGYNSALNGVIYTLKGKLP